MIIFRHGGSFSPEDGVLILRLHLISVNGTEFNHSFCIWSIGSLLFSSIGVWNIGACWRMADPGLEH